MSPYLRRPLRPLQKVLNEREEGDDEEGAALTVSEDSAESGSTTWSVSRKAVGASD